MERPVRKTTRLAQFDYGQPGYYFITICTRNKQKILCDIVGTGLPDGPLVQLTKYGDAVKTQLEHMSKFYDHIVLEKYVIMPNHIHLLLHIPGFFPNNSQASPQNTAISGFVGTFKRFTNQKIGRNIWQSRSYDHVIRCEEDYQNVWAYINTNPMRWEKDRFYLQEDTF